MFMRYIIQFITLKEKRMRANKTVIKIISILVISGIVVWFFFSNAFWKVDIKYKITVEGSFDKDNQEDISIHCGFIRSNKDALYFLNKYRINNSLPNINYNNQMWIYSEYNIDSIDIVPDENTLYIHTSPRLSDCKTIYLLCITKYSDCSYKFMN